MSVLLMLIHWIGCMWYMFTSEPTLTAEVAIPQGASWVDTALEIADGQFQGKWIPPYNLNDQYTDFYYISDDLKYMSIYYYGMIMLVGNEIAPQ
jgi:hypothetical protein